MVIVSAETNWSLNPDHNKTTPNPNVSPNITASALPTAATFWGDETSTNYSGNVGIWTPATATSPNLTPSKKFESYDKSSLRVVGGTGDNWTPSNLPSRSKLTETKKSACDPKVNEAYSAFNTRIKDDIYASDHAFIRTFDKATRADPSSEDRLLEDLVLIGEHRKSHYLVHFAKTMMASAAYKYLRINESATDVEIIQYFNRYYKEPILSNDTKVCKALQTIAEYRDSDDLISFALGASPGVGNLDPLYVWPQPPTRGGQFPPSEANSEALAYDMGTFSPATIWSDRVVHVVVGKKSNYKGFNVHRSILNKLLWHSEFTLARESLAVVESIRLDSADADTFTTLLTLLYLPQELYDYGTAQLIIPDIIPAGGRDLTKMTDLYVLASKYYLKEIVKAALPYLKVSSCPAALLTACEYVHQEGVFDVDLREMIKSRLVELVLKNPSILRADGVACVCDNPESACETSVMVFKDESVSRDMFQEISNTFNKDHTPYSEGEDCQDWGEEGNTADWTSGWNNGMSTDDGWGLPTNQDIDVGLGDDTIPEEVSDTCSLSDTDEETSGLRAIAIKDSKFSECGLCFIKGDMIENVSGSSRPPLTFDGVNFIPFLTGTCRDASGFFPASYVAVLPDDSDGAARVVAMVMTGGQGEQAGGNSVSWV